jgi:hypothetical protein
MLFYRKGSTVGHVSAACAGVFKSWLDLQQEQQQHGWPAKSLLLQADLALWSMWEGITAATDPMVPKVLSVAFEAVGWAQPTLHMVQQCVRTSLAAAAAAGLNSSNSSSSSFNSNATTSSSTALPRCNALLIYIQAQVLRLLSSVLDMSSKCSGGPVQVTHVIQAAYLTPLQQCMSSEVVATAALQQLEACHRLLQQRRQQRQQQQQTFSISFSSSSSSSGGGGNSSSSSSSAVTVADLQPQQQQQQQQQMAAATSAAGPAAQLTPPWLLPDVEAYVSVVVAASLAAATTGSKAATPLEMLKQLSNAGLETAVAIVCEVSKALVAAEHQDASTDGSEQRAGSAEQRVEALQRSHAVSPAALRLTLEL